MKKPITIYIIRTILLLFMVIVLSFCSSESNKEVKKYSEPTYFDYDEIKKRGKLIALTSYSSISYFIYKGRPMGFEYELLDKLAKSMEVELEIVVLKNMDELIEQLNNGVGDIIATNVTVTNERKKYVSFTKPITFTKQVLVQKKPQGWRNFTRSKLEESLVRNQIELIGEEVYVKEASAYEERMRNLSEEIGGMIIVKTDKPETETEQLIKRVAEGKIKFTISDENIARINQTYYPDLDVKTPVSFPQQIAWAVRTNSPELLKLVDEWLVGMKKKPEFRYIYNKYYRNSKQFTARIESDFYSQSGGKISPYDELIFEFAKSIDWDWRLMAAQIYQESKFDPLAMSWTGATGLMQLMPATAEMYNVTDPTDPVQSLRGGTRFLKYLNKFWEERIEDPEERVKFILASYNVGAGHVMDAIRLAEKLDYHPKIWDDNVAEALLLKASSEYYNDPVVRIGYCRGEEPYKYVQEILERYSHYKKFIPEDIYTTEKASIF